MIFLNLGMQTLRTGMIFFSYIFVVKIIPLQFYHFSFMKLAMSALKINLNRKKNKFLISKGEYVSFFMYE